MGAGKGKASIMCNMSKVVAPFLFFFFFVKVVVWGLRGCGEVWFGNFCMGWRKGDRSSSWWLGEGKLRRFLFLKSTLSLKNMWWVGTFGTGAVMSTIFHVHHNLRFTLCMFSSNIPLEPWILNIETPPMCFLLWQ